MERKVKYDLAFKLKCVKLNIENYHSIPSISEKYRVNQSQLKQWVQDYRTLGLNGIISTKNKSYTAAFKLKVIRAIEQERLSLSQAKYKFDIPNASIITQWQKKYATFGLDGLIPKCKGRPPKDMNTNKRKPRKSNKPLTREEELLKENEALRCEVAFLKKYNALVQALEKQERQQQSKPSKN